MDTGAKGASLQGRRAIDGASSKDRGRLLGLWNRWNAKPGDEAAREAFATPCPVRSRRASCAPRACRKRRWTTRCRSRPKPIASSN
jgi:ATP-dependent helicase HrpA